MARCVRLKVRRTQFTANFTMNNMEISKFLSSGAGAWRRDTYALCWPWNAVTVQTLRTKQGVSWRGTGHHLEDMIISLVLLKRWLARSSNNQWVFRHLWKEYCEELHQRDLRSVFVTVGDADTPWHPQFFRVPAFDRRQPLSFTVLRSCAACCPVLPFRGFFVRVAVVGVAVLLLFRLLFFVVFLAAFPLLSGWSSCSWLFRWLRGRPGRAAVLSWPSACSSFLGFVFEDLVCGIFVNFDEVSYFGCFAAFSMLRGVRQVERFAACSF